MSAAEADDMLAKLRPNIANVLQNIATASRNRPEDLQVFMPRLVAVSKTKPVEAVIEAYKAGQRHFGENYVQELVEKSADSQIREQCPDIRWHFIGHLQRNKINKVLSAANIYMIETVDTAKVADTINQSLERLQRERLNVMLQVNTSQEDNKNGCPPEQIADLAEHVIQNCPKLHVVGLMTIGAFNHDHNTGPNPDFQKLIACRRVVTSRLGREEMSLELSMGMSGDYEHAISVGSTSVRIGSTIFGARASKIVNRPIMNGPIPVTVTSTEEPITTTVTTTEDRADEAR